MEKLERLLEVKNVDRSNNNGGQIEHEVKCNMYFERHMERIRINVCKLGRTKVILGMPWLAAHNPEINWEKGKVKMSRCPPWCGRSKEKKKERQRIRTAEKTVEKLVPRRFWR